MRSILSVSIGLCLICIACTRNDDPRDELQAPLQISEPTAQEEVISLYTKMEGIEHQTIYLGMYRINFDTAQITLELCDVIGHHRYDDCQHIAFGFEESISYQNHDIRLASISPLDSNKQRKVEVIIGES